MNSAPRIFSIRKRLGWTQVQMADHLGLNRSRVSHMENGQRESGPVKRLLDQLDHSIADREVAPAGRGGEAA